MLRAVTGYHKPTKADLDIKVSETGERVRDVIIYGGIEWLSTRVAWKDYKRFKGERNPKKQRQNKWKS